MEEDNNTICISIQSRSHPETRCGNRRKEGSLFCGVHAKVAKVTVFEGVRQSGLLDRPETIRVAVEAGVGAGEEPFVLTSDAELRAILLQEGGAESDSRLSVTLLRNYVKASEALSAITDPSQSRSKMIQDLTTYFRTLTENESKVSEVIRIQAWIRRWIVFRRTKCSNRTDILTMESIFDVPGSYYYCFYDEVTKGHYGYDIRVLVRVLYDATNPKHVAKCPYTNRPFTTVEFARIEAHIEKLRQAKIPLEVVRPKMSKEKEVELKCVTIFQKIDMLDNYTDSRWFMSMTKDELLHFYEVARDIWQYRVQMGSEAKKRILKDGRAFEMPISYLSQRPQLCIIQNFILNEINRFVTEGINREEQKLGAMLILTALVEVSPAAAEALPHLVMALG
jgi:hypothetical protein